MESLTNSPIKSLTGAVQSNDVALIRQVLEEHPELQATLDEPLPGLSFDTPALIAAVNHKNHEMIEVLLNAGASINARTKWWAGGFGVLDVCDPELAPYLIHRGAYVDIHAAARLGFVDRLKELIHADPALVNARGGDGQTPLHFAATIEIASCLLDHGAEIDIRDIDHESTPAQYMAAIRPRRLDVARYLISRGAQTDILLAAAVGDLNLIRHHLEAKPEAIHITVSENDFPRHNPNSGGSIYIFGFGWAKTPHLIAHEFGHSEVLRLLMERSPLELQLATACEVGDEALAREIALKRPKLDSARIISAAMQNNAHAVHLMLECGWPADIENDKKQTPLHWAAWHGNAEMTTELLLHDAPLEVREHEYGGSPLDWARYGSEHGWHPGSGDYPKTIQLLTQAAAVKSETAPDPRPDGNASPDTAP
jgi:ankyrin repeat protein